MDQYNVYGITGLSGQEALVACTFIIAVMVVVWKWIDDTYFGGR